ncbi:MAG: Ig-like domain-containing protein [Thermoanaerobaculia bacterium]
MHRICRGIAMTVLLFVLAGPLRADIYVANFNGPSVTVYATSAVGNAAPVRTIAGSNTGIAGPNGVTVDTVNNELYVADFVSQSVRVFALAAPGNVSPLRTIIAGPNSGIVQPRMVAVDTVNNEIFVLCINESIRVFPRLASGDAVPSRVIAGTNTTFNNPLSAVLDSANNELIVTSFDSAFANARILAFARTAPGNTAPLRSIFGSNTQIGPECPNAAVDAVNNEIVARVNPAYPSIPSALLVFLRTATGNVSPVRTISGSATGLFRLGAVRVDLANNRIITTNAIANAEDPAKLLVFSRTASGNTKPLMTIAGPATGLKAPSGVDFDTAGGLTSTVTDATVPTANPQVLSTGVGTPITLTLTASDTDDSSFSFTIASEPSHGAITSFNPSTGSVTFTPAFGFGGTDSFTFVASDVVNTSLPATVTIEVILADGAIPALDVRGLLVLGLILAASGVFFLRRSS